MNSHVVASNTEASILARVIESDQRVNTLSAKAGAGSLTEAEAQELDSYLHIGRLLAVMQSRARRFLHSAEYDPARQ
jgi:hypothetical protein